MIDVVAGVAAAADGARTPLACFLDVPIAILVYFRLAADVLCGYRW